MMTKLTKAALLMMLLSGCASYNAYERARTAEVSKQWDTAIEQYEKALTIDPGNTRYRLSLQRARRQAAREHFEKGKSLRAAAASATGPEQVRLMQLAATELQITVKLDPTNQFAAVEMGKAIQALQEAASAAIEGTTIEDIKKRAAKTNI